MDHEAVRLVIQWNVLEQSKQEQRDAQTMLHKRDAGVRGSDDDKKGTC